MVAPGVTICRTAATPHNARIEKQGLGKAKSSGVGKKQSVLKVGTGASSASLAQDCAMGEGDQFLLPASCVFWPPCRTPSPERGHGQGCWWSEGDVAGAAPKEQPSYHQQHL